MTSTRANITSAEIVSISLKLPDLVYTAFNLSMHDNDTADKQSYACPRQNNSKSVSITAGGDEPSG
jgi:hypothetical protein